MTPPNLEAPAAGVRLTPRMAATLAALAACGCDCRAAADSLGLSLRIVQGRASMFRRLGLLPPVRPGRPPKARRDPDAPPAVVREAAERLLAGRPRENDWRIVWAWDGYEGGLGADRRAVEAAGRIVARTGEGR